MFLIKKITLLVLAFYAFGCNLHIGESGETTHIEGLSVGCLNGINKKVDLYLKGQLLEPDIVQTANCLKVALTIFKDRVQGRKAGEWTPQELRTFIQDLFLQDNIIRDELLNQLVLLKTVIIGGANNKLTHQDIEKFILLVELLKKEAIFFQPYFQAFYVLNQPELKEDLSQLKNIEKALKSSINRVLKFFNSFANPYDLKDMGALFQELDFFSDHQHNILYLKEKIGLLGALKSFVFGTSDSAIHPEEWDSFLTSFAYLLSAHVHWLVLKKQKQWLSSKGTSSFSSVVRDLSQFLALTVQKRAQNPAGTKDFLNLSHHLKQAGFLSKNIKNTTIKNIWNMLFGKIFNPQTHHVSQTVPPQKASPSLLSPQESETSSSFDPKTLKPVDTNKHYPEYMADIPHTKNPLSLGDPPPSLSPEETSAQMATSSRIPFRQRQRQRQRHGQGSKKAKDVPAIPIPEAKPQPLLKQGESGPPSRKDEEENASLTQDHINHLKSFLKIWTSVQNFLDYTYDSSEEPHPLSIKPSTFFSSSALWVQGEPILNDILSMKVLYAKGHKIHISEETFRSPLTLDYKNVKMYSFFRFIAEMIKMGYKVTSPKEKGVSQDELKNFFTDFRPFAVNMGWMAPRSETSVMGEGEAEFIAANILTAFAKGFHSDYRQEEYLSSKEIVEYIAYATSFGLHLSEIGPAMFSLCGKKTQNTEEQRTWKNSLYNKDCVHLHLMDVLEKQSQNLPNFQRALKNMQESQKQQLADALIHISYSTEEKYQTETYMQKEHLKNIIMALYFVETTITRYDSNKNLSLEHEEIKQAFPTFQGYLSRVLIRLICRPTDDLVESFYSYALYKNDLPSSSRLDQWEKWKATSELLLHHYWPRIIGSDYWSLYLDRTKLTSVFSTLVKGLLSKKKSVQGRECSPPPLEEEEK